MVSVEALMLAGLANATPLALAALGETVVERAGRVNLGVEGMMALGAAVSVLAGIASGDPIVALLAGALSGMLLSLVFAFSVIVLGGDQIVTGLLLVFMGIGLSELVGARTGGAPGEPIPKLGLGVDAIELLAIILSLALWLVLYRTWFGVELRALGEAEEAARDRGLRVRSIRAAAIALGGLLAGLAGAYMAMGLHYARWYSGITAGWGWIAIGIVILGYWHPIGVIAASYLVGLLFASRPLMPVWGVPEQIADAMPYLAVLAALAVVTLLSERLGLTPPSIVWRRD